MQIETWHILVWVALMWFASLDPRMSRTEIVFESEVRRYKRVFACLLFLPVILMAAYGPKRSDVWAYMNAYRNMPGTLRLGWNYIQAADEPGFALFSIVTKQLFSGSESAYRLLIALVHAIPLIAVLRKYSDNFIFSFYVFVASGIHLSWMMNGLRQFMAVTMIFVTTPWLIQKKYFRVILVILLAATFHRTAIVMLPVVFIVQGKAWNWKTNILIMASVLATYYIAQNVDVFDTFVETVGYSLEAAYQSGDDGTNPIRVLVNAIPMIMAFISRKRLRAENNPIINICINMSVITTGIYLMSMVTSGIMVGRMPIYTSLYNLILLPYVIKVTFDKALQRYVVISAVIAYYLYGIMG